MSARISGVKNFVSIGESFVRAFPFSQVQSAYANGSAGAAFVAPWVPTAPAGPAVPAPEPQTDSAEFVTFAALSVPAGSCTGAALLRPMPATSLELEVLGFSDAAMDPDDPVPPPEFVAVVLVFVSGATFALPPASSAFLPVPPFASNSSTRRSNCSTRSSSIRSRSVKAAGASGFFSAFAPPPASLFVAPPAASFAAESFAPPSSASTHPGAPKPNIPATTNTRSTPIHVAFFPNEPIYLSLQRLQSNLDRQRRMHALMPTSSIASSVRTRVGRASDWRQAQPTSLPT